MPQRPKRLALCATTAVLALVTASCGSSKSPSTSGSGTTPSSAPSASSNKIAAEVPAAIKAKGTLTVAADATYAPNEFIASDGHTVIGMDPDLAQALGAVMDLKMKVVNATFDSIIPGLAAGKYDLGISSFGDTKEREKTVDFVTYFQAGTSFYVKAQGGPSINGLADLCGHKVAVEKGTTQALDVTAQQKKCLAAGKPTVTLEVYPDQNGANLAIASGRADIGMADSPVAAYQVKQSNGQFKLVGQPYSVVPYGIAIPKNNGLAQPLLDAMKEIISNGTYLRILKKWGVEAGAISNPQINGAVS